MKGYFLFLILYYVKSAEFDLKKEACMNIVVHFSKMPEFDIKNLIVPREQKVNRMKLMNYILFDIFELCMENITEKHIDQSLKKDYTNITPKKLGISSGKYQTNEIPDIGFDFLTEILKSQTRKEL